MKALGDIGLKADEARSYLALLEHGPGTAAEVADAAGIRRPKVYETLKSLGQRGFCLVTVGRVTRFQALPPEVALAEWTQRRAHERALATQRDEDLAQELVRTLPEPDGAPRDGGRGYMEARVGVQRTLEMFHEIARHAVRRLDVVVGEPVIQAREQWGQYEIEALRRGVRVRVIYASALLADERRYRPVLEAGGEARRAEELPLKMLVRDDGAEATVSLVDHSGDEFVAMSVMIRHPELATPFQLLFNREWRRAAPLAGTDEAAPAAVSPESGSGSGSASRAKRERR